MIISEIRVSGIEDVELRLGNMKKNAPQVLSRAINRAVSNVKKNMGKETSSLYYISSGNVKKTVNITKATKSKLKAAAISQGSGIALSKFKVNPGTPVKYRGTSRSPKVYRAGVKKSGGLKPLDGNPKGFIAIMKNSEKIEGASDHKGVWVRTSSNSFPIKQLYGPSVPQMVKNENIMEKINREANETLQKRIDAEISNILQKG